MRIRKRQVPFPLASLSPIPLSDLQLHQSPVVQLQLHRNPHRNPFQEDDTAAYFDPPSSRQPHQPIGDEFFSDATVAHPEATDCPVWLQKDERAAVEGEKSNDTRKGNFLGAETESIVILQQPNSPQQAVGRWYEEEKAFPLKKRRGNIERSSSHEEMSTKKDNKKMKTKMNKRCLQSNVSHDQEIGEDNKETKEGVVDGGSSTGSTATNVKKRARGGALMEGSRCSRVNGRGWRCCQQTLVGYSLCEHHLGKGRLRSMTNVRNRSMASATAAPKKAAMPSQPLSSTTFSSSDDKDSQKHTSPADNNKNDVVEDHEGREEKKPLTVSKRKKKLGIVKARSISSLLEQVNSAIAVDENSK
ncbi:uncharacterized protein LOC8267082 isoform X1 [Ricinus communis]|uniref:uncharacterized protein LOC8267082 isoform X1 n=1 Tax=Ricinus communis TaxID=3988 RepID=UPI0007728DD4|nr:uncharacterized protein LOC8267082 isoform X1 [Ricinus communis]|eukprot:XP_015581804.1 uncharacterized protein LOC8267082 isoform X1 [Ricinus communis]